MIHNTFFVPFVSVIALLFGMQVSAQSTLEFDTRLDAATVLLPLNGSALSYGGASPGFRLSFSLTSINKVSGKSSLLYGISYASSGFNRGRNGYWCGNSFDGLTPEALNRVFENNSMDMEKVTYISLPLGVRYTLKEGKQWFIYGQAMLEPMMYYRTTYIYTDQELGPIKFSERNGQMKNVQLGVGLATGFERKLINDWTFALRPTLRMHLTKEKRTDEPLEGNARHISMGLAVSLGHSF